METENKLQIYPSKERYLEATREKTDRSLISEANKSLIARYETYLASKGTTCDLTRADRSQKLRTICEWLVMLKDKQNVHTDLSMLDRTDVQILIAHINTLKDIGQNTKATYRKRFKQFFKWYEEEDVRLESPDYEVKGKAQKLYKYLKTLSVDAKIIQANPETIITEQDRNLVLEKGCTTPKERAFISLLHESGCRAAEFLNLKIGSLNFKSNHLEVEVPDGKTGRRKIYAIRSIGHILGYLEGHPQRGDSQAYLWVSEGSYRKNKPLMHMGGQKLITRCFARAGLNKKHNWHWFRHSRATILAPKMTEVMLCKYMGWVVGSGQIKRYVHLCSGQLEDVYLSIHGMRTEENKKDLPIKCVCGTLNNSNERYCYKCMRPLSVEVAIQDNEEKLQVMTEETLKTMQFFMEMAKNPALMKEFEEFKKNKR